MAVGVGATGEHTVTLRYRDDHRFPAPRGNGQRLTKTVLNTMRKPFGSPKSQVDGWVTSSDVSGKMGTISGG